LLALGLASLLGLLRRLGLSLGLLLLTLFDIDVARAQTARLGRAHLGITGLMGTRPGIPIAVVVTGLSLVVFGLVVLIVQGLHFLIKLVGMRAHHLAQLDQGPLLLILLLCHMISPVFNLLSFGLHFNHFVKLTLVVQVL
jgi:hypothetical protein